MVGDLHDLLGISMAVFSMYLHVMYLLLLASFDGKFQTCVLFPSLSQGIGYLGLGLNLTASF